MHKARPGFIDIYRAMRARFGFLDWWPGDTPDEILLGAILAQSTSWKNAERAIANLRAAGLLSVHRIARARLGALRQAARPSGYYNQKALRLKSICSHIVSKHHGLAGFFSQDAVALRRELLSLNGIGPETADSIILYAAEKPVFVIDAYTRRAVQRIYDEEEERGYDELQSIIQASIPRDVALYNDFHAQFVELGKNYCRKKPLCGRCPLSGICGSAHGETAHMRIQ
ncbi:MAG: endonuclease III domain-containing protein [Candidatus Marsarchaeota archaeon]|nr:endonuclease III domain-containing protein [Candidatus Marsarchaeota archaeon]